MNKVLISLAFFTSTQLFALNSPATKKPHTLNDFLKLYIDQNAQLRSTYLSYQQSKIANEALRLYSYLPTLNLSHSRSYSQLSDESQSDTVDATESRSWDLGLSGSIPDLAMSWNTTLYSNSESITFADDEVTGQSHSGSFSFSTSFNLLRGNFEVGQASFEQADISESIADLTYKQSLITGAKNLIAQYLEAVVSQKNYQIGLDAISINKKDLARSRAKYRAGKIAKLDMMNLETQEASFEIQAINLKQSLINAFNSLFQTINMDPNNLDEEKYPLKEIQQTLVDQNKINRWLKEKINFQKTTNIDYLIAKKNLDNTKISVAVSENNNRGSLALNLGLSESADTDNIRTRFYPNDTSGQSISLTYSMPIGLVQEKANLEQARIGLRQQQISIDQLKNTLKLTWENLKTRYYLAKKEYDLSQKLVKAARARYRSSLRTADLGTTYRNNVIMFLSELNNAKLDRNRKFNTLLLTEIEFYEFQGDLGFIK